MTIDARPATTAGIVLWRLQRSTGRHLTCQACELDGELFLAVRDLDTGMVPVAESHRDFAALLNRAGKVRHDYLATGWTEC